MLGQDGLQIKGRPKPKHWAWKSGFHEFEHALVAYITASQFEGKPLKLHYAFSAQPNAQIIRLYYFSGDPSDLQRRSDGVTVVTFDSIAFP